MNCTQELVPLEALVVLAVPVELDPQAELGQLEVQVELEVLGALVELEALAALVELVVQEVNRLK